MSIHARKSCWYYYSSKDTKCLLLKAVDEEQTTKTEFKSISMKEAKIADNGDSFMQDTV